MGFTSTSAYIGPYCYTLTRGKAGESRQFRFPIQADFEQQFGQTQMVAEGRIAVTWSGGDPAGVEKGIGESFIFDQGVRPVPAVIRAANQWKAGVEFAVEDTAEGVLLRPSSRSPPPRWMK